MTRDKDDQNQPLRKPRHKKPTKKQWQRAICSAIAAGCSVKKAAEIAKIDLSCVYRCKREDPEFAKEWEEALERCLEGIEAFAHSRGTHDPHMAIWLLSRRRPDKYGERKKDAATPQQVQIIIQTPEPPKEQA